MSDLPKLTLGRYSGESLIITLAEGVDPSTPIGDLLDEIWITYNHHSGNQCKLSIAAPREFKIIREELLYPA